MNTHTHTWLSVTSDTRRKSHKECYVLSVCLLSFVKHSEECLRKHEFVYDIQACSHAAIVPLCIYILRVCHCWYEKIIMNTTHVSPCSNAVVYFMQGNAVFLLENWSRGGKPKMTGGKQVLAVCANLHIDVQGGQTFFKGGQMLPYPPKKKH